MIISFEPHVNVSDGENAHYWTTDHCLEAFTNVLFEPSGPIRADKGDAVTARSSAGDLLPSSSGRPNARDPAFSSLIAS